MMEGPPSPSLWRTSFARNPRVARVPSEGWSRWRDLHSRGAMCLAVYETAAVAAEPHRRKGLPSVAPRGGGRWELRFWTHYSTPEVTFCKDMTGTALQVFFGMLSLFNRLACHIDLIFQGTNFDVYGH